MAGGGTTTALQQFEELGGVTLSPVASVTPGGSPWEVSELPTGLTGGLSSLSSFLSGNPVLMLALLGGAGFLGYEIFT
jgi:hypothetical protein